MRIPSVRFSLAALAALMLINGLFLLSSYAAQRNQVNRASSIARAVDRHVQSARSVLRSMAGASAGARSGELDRLVDLTLQSTPYFTDLVVLDHASGISEGFFPNFRTLPGNEAVYDAPFLVLDPKTGDPSIYLAQPLAGSSVILGRLDLRPLIAAVDAGKLEHPQEMVYLADEKGLILARTWLELEPPAALPAFNGGANQGVFSASSIIIQNAQPCSQAVARLQNASWYVISIAPLKGAYLPYFVTSFMMLIAVTVVWVVSDTYKRRHLAPEFPLPGLPAARVSPSKPRLRPKDAPSEDEERILAEALQDTAAALNSDLNFDEMMARILENVGKVVPHDSSNIMLVEPDGDTVRIVAARGYTYLGLQGYPERLRLSVQNTSTLSYMNATGQPLVIPDTAQDASWYDIPETAWIRSYVAAPIRVKDRIIGYLNLNSPTPGFYQSHHAKRLQAFADQAGIAIESARLMQELHLTNRELVKTYDITLQGWSKALELRDYETEGHSQRVVELTLKVAARVGIQEPELTHIRYGVLLHDIGKIGIPDAILFKPGPLTDEEWKTMRRHPQYALDILASIPYLAPSIDIPYSHHERWDGTGYPRGLMGEEIPLAARIFAVVDVWDGLRQSRPYHASWSFEEAVRYIKSQSGKQFDPNIADIFLQLISET